MRHQDASGSRSSRYPWAVGLKNTNSRTAPSKRTVVEVERGLLADVAHRCVTVNLEPLAGAVGNARVVFDGDAVLAACHWTVRIPVTVRRGQERDGWIGHRVPDVSAVVALVVEAN